MDHGWMFGCVELMHGRMSGWLDAYIAGIDEWKEGGNEWMDEAGEMEGRRGGKQRREEEEGSRGEKKKRREEEERRRGEQKKREDRRLGSSEEICSLQRRTNIWCVAKGRGRVVSPRGTDG